jgi:dTDP-D-glucose 4,6-dehydratase
MLRHRDVVISTGCFNWQGNTNTYRGYRQIFDANNLPDVYNAIPYWRLSETSQQFYQLVRDIFANWTAIKTLLKFPEDRPSTDVVYAIAAHAIGPELVTMPFASYPQITHMRPRIAGTAGAWCQELVWEYHDNQLRIESVPQWGAFHYHEKTWQP